EVTRAAATSGTYTPGNPLTLEAFAYKSRTFFDYNDNVVFAQVEDRGNTSSVDGNLDEDDIPPIVTDPDPVGGVAWLDSAFEYDILGNRVKTTQEVEHEIVDPEEPAVLKDLHSYARYDRNENLVVSVAPEGTAVRTRYDDRDMPFSRTRGFTGTLDEGFASGQLPSGASFTVADVRGGIASTTFSHYNKNGSLIETVDAEDSDSSSSNNSTIAGTGDRTRYIYDGFDRPTSVVDSCGNQVVYQYDPAGNRIRVLHFGPNGGASPTSDGQIATPVSISVNGVPTVQVGNLVNSNLLAASEFKFDESGRMYQSDRVLFVAAGLSPNRTPDVDDNDASISTLYPSDNQGIPGITTVTILGRVTSRSEFDRKSRSTFGVEDDLDTYRTDYDGADRTVKSTDPEQNLVEYAFDEDSNVIETKETDHAQRTGVSDQVFHSTSFHDSLGRLILSVDSLGQADDYRYDSRGNMVAHADAQGPGTRTVNRRGLGATGEVTINNFGNVSLFFFDGIGRQKKSEQIMTASGEGDGEHIGASTRGIKNEPDVDEAVPPTADTNQAGGDGIIRVGYVWDSNSLLSALLDDQGNVTCYLYDNSSRRVVETKGLTTNDVDNKFLRTNIFGSGEPGPRVVFTPTVPTLDSPAVIPPEKIDDQLTELRAGVNEVKAEFASLADRRDELPPTSIIYGYSRDDEVLILEDENDSEIYSRFDAIGRRIATRVFRAGQSDSFTGDPIFAPTNMSPDVKNPTPGYNSSTDPVVGTTKVDSEFDGLGRLRLAKDNNEPGTTDDDSEVVLFYDSLSRLFEEGQKLGTGDTRVVSSSWRADDQRVAVTYPTSGTTQRKILHTFDNLDRLKTVKDDGAQDPIATYLYIGKWRVDQRNMLNGVNLEVAYDTGRRVTEYKHVKNSTTMVGFGHNYNRTNNKLIQDSLHDHR
ncbi:MAG: RHS repeat domain-containing protein, partial [Planctomycetota bacterium]